MFESDGRASKRRHLSFRLKLTLWVVGVFAGVELAVASVVLLYQRSEVWDRFDREMSVRLRGLIEDIDPARGDFSREGLAVAGLRDADFLFLGDLKILVLDELGELRASSTDDLPGSLVEDFRTLAARAPDRPLLASTVAVDGDGLEQRLRLACQTFIDSSGGAYTMCIASSDAYAAASLRTATIVLLLVLPAGLVVAGGAAWWVGSLATAPIRDATRYAEHLTPETVDENVRIESHGSEADALREALDSARERLRAGYDMQSRFLANISHELKTPISVLLTQAETLRRDDGMPAEAVDYLESSVEELERLGRLIESFLLLTRVREGKGRIRDANVEFNDLVMDSIERCAPMAELYGVALNPTLIETDGSTNVYGEPELIRTAIDNLIRNAIRFSPKGERVDIEASDDGDRLSVRVRDRGPGIPEQILPKLFDRFAQSADESRLGRGTGLGLSIAQGIAELHEGEIRAENLDRGAELSISLPRASARPRVQTEG